MEPYLHPQVRACAAAGEKRDLNRSPADSAVKGNATLMTRPKIFSYSINQKLRRAVNWIMRWVTTRSKEERLDLRSEKLKKILLVRATFRMGDSILAIPAIVLFRKNFPQARIDFA